LSNKAFSGGEKVARNEPDEVVFSFKYKVMKIQAFSTSSTAKAVPLLPLGEGKYEIAYIPPLKPSPFSHLGKANMKLHIFHR